MTIASLICEYNPFHNGHRFLLDEMRRRGAEAVVACMSGDFTQRGEAAIFPKEIRAVQAVRQGVDLVIELPVTYACAGAERFAYGGVCLLNALGCVDRLGFGSESGDLTLLQKAARAERDPEVQALIRSKLGEGKTFAALREEAVRSLHGDETAGVLRQPNQILGVEYLKALDKTGSRICPFTVRRMGGAHDSPEPVGTTASASYIRELIRSGKDYGEYVPEGAVVPVPEDFIRQQARLEGAMYYRLVTMTEQDYARLPEMSEGLENRLYKASRKGETVEEILQLAKCRRYPLARLRRAVIHAFLQLTAEDFKPLPPYIKVLAFSRTGQSILRLMKKTAVLPVVTRHADFLKLPPALRELSFVYRGNPMLPRKGAQVQRPLT